MRRRTFLGLAATAAVVRPALGERSEPPGRGRVVSVVQPEEGPRATDSLPMPKLDAAADSLLERGLEKGIAALTDLSAAEAWALLFGAEDRVAIKLNCLAGRHLAPRPVLVHAIVRQLRKAGVRAEAIVLFDRTSRELERAGFPVRTDKDDVQCFGTDALKGGGYSQEVLEHGSIGSLFTRIMTDHATALINIGVCKDHDLAGVSAGAKNLYGLIHNPNRYHANACDPFVADLLDHPAVRPKLRLTVIDAARAQCHGGPAYNPAYTFSGSRVLLSRDPVAVDRIAWEMIEAERARRSLPTLDDEKRAPKWIDTAAALGLGTADRARIDLREVAA